MSDYFWPFLIALLVAQYLFVSREPAINTAGLKQYSCTPYCIEQ